MSGVGSARRSPGVRCSSAFYDDCSNFPIGAFAESFALRWDVSQTTLLFFARCPDLKGGYTTFSILLGFCRLRDRWSTQASCSPPGAPADIVASVALGLLALYAGLYAMRLIFT